MNEAVHAYLPIDRRQALLESVELPTAVSGSALEADLSGFTALTEALARELGEQRGAEELAVRLNVIYDGLIRAVHRFGGTVLGFSGDALTCWFDGDDGARASATALQMQAWMVADEAAAGSLQLKIAVATGRARRFVVGDPEVQRLEGIAGALVDELIEAEHAAGPGEIVLARSTVDSLGPRVAVARRDEFGVLESLRTRPEACPWPSFDGNERMNAFFRPWLLAPVFERLSAGLGDFLADLRPGVALFLRFLGLEFERDRHALARLDEFVRSVQSILSAYEATLVQLTIGDKGSYLYAAFGAPIAHEDDADRALNAALDLLGLADRDGRTLQVSIGVASGRFRAGAYGGSERRTYGVLGDAVNLSARLMQAAGTGEVIATQDVRDTAGPSFDWEGLPALTVKGKTEPVAVARLRGVRGSAAARAPSAERLPMVGREAELETLQRAVEQTAAGEGRVVGVVAEAGLGKSRLVEELLTGTRARGIADAWSECPSFGVRGSYVVWRPAWEQLLGLGEAANDGVPELLAAQLQRGGATLASRAAVLAPLLGLDLPDNDLTASFDAKLRKTVLETTLAEWLAATMDAPLVLVLEDCHWIDALSEDLLLAIGRAAHRLPLLILLTYRPRGVEDGGPLSVESLPHFAPMPLGRLAEEDADRLIRLRLGEDGTLTEPLATQLARRAEGNPFYIEELANYAREQGEGGLLELPSSLQALVLSRIDRLRERPRATLRVASAVGRTFAAGLLGSVHPELGDDEDVLGSLETLGRADFVQVDAADHHLYAFKHAVTQEAAYSTIAGPTRASLHGRIGRLLETRAGDALEAQLDLLAHHFGRSDDAERKRGYLLRAGEAAQARYANDAAVAYYRQVVPLLDEANRGKVLVDLGKTLELRGDWDDASAAYAEALALARSRGDAQAEARSEAAEGELRRKQGRYGESLELFDAARAKLEAVGDRSGVAEVLHFAAVLAAQQGATDTARARFEESLALRRALEDRRQIAASLNGLAIVAEYEGDLAAAGELFAQALEILTELGDRWAIAALTNNLGNTLLQQGDAASARPLFEQAVALEREVGDPAMLANFLCNLGNAARDLGDLDAASGAYAESLGRSRELGDRWLIAYLLEDVAVLAALRGNAAGALQLAAAGERLREEIGSPRPEASKRELDKRLESARASLGEAAGAGAALSLEEAIEAARQI